MSKVTGLETPYLVKLDSCEFTCPGILTGFATGLGCRMLDMPKGLRDGCTATGFLKCPNLLADADADPTCLLLSVSKCQLS